MNRSERIVNLDRQLEKLKKRNRQAESVLRIPKQRLEHAEAVRERKLETRRKILIGKAVLHDIEDDPVLRAWYFTRCHGHLADNRERKLFHDLTFDNGDAPQHRLSVTSPFRGFLDRLSSLTSYFHRQRNTPS